MTESLPVIQKKHFFLACSNETVINKTSGRSDQGEEEWRDVYIIRTSICQITERRNHSIYGTPSSKRQYNKQVTSFFFQTSKKLNGVFPCLDSRLIKEKITSASKIHLYQVTIKNKKIIIMLYDYRSNSFNLFFIFSCSLERQIEFNDLTNE